MNEGSTILTIGHVYVDLGSKTADRMARWGHQCIPVDVAACWLATRSIPAVAITIVAGYRSTDRITVHVHHRLLFRSSSCFWYSSRNTRNTAPAMNSTGMVNTIPYPKNFSQFQ